MIARRIRVTSSVCPLQVTPITSTRVGSYPPCFSRRVIMVLRLGTPDCECRAESGRHGKCVVVNLPLRRQLPRAPLHGMSGFITGSSQRVEYELVTPFRVLSGRCTKCGDVAEEPLRTASVPRLFEPVSCGTQSSCTTRAQSPFLVRHRGMHV
jgi:hypothetical protein